MADKKLNEVPVVSDIVTIFGKRSNGEIVQIDKSNLATLLGELMNSLKLFPFMEREQILSDINKAIVPGVYGILNNRLDNLPITDWFVLIVISWRYYVVQIAYSLNYFTIYSRRSSESGETWSNWQQIATEQ